MRRIDELYLQYPFYGSRQMMRHLAREGTRVGRQRVRRLMRLLGLEAIYRKPRTSVANPGTPGVIPSCCEGLPSSARIRCGASWTGRVGGCWRGVCPTRWTPSSAWRR